MSAISTDGMDFELSETQVEVFEKLQDAEVNGGFF